MRANAGAGGVNGEKKRFDGQRFVSRTILKRRPVTYICDGIPVQGFIFQIKCSRNVDAGLRNHLRVRAQIQSRHGLLRADSLPGNDVARQAIRPSQHSSRQADLPGLDGPADFARGNHATAHFDGVHHVRFETEMPTELRKNSRVPRLMVAEVEILAYDHGLRVKRFHQDALHEIGRRPARKEP